MPNSENKSKPEIHLQDETQDQVILCGYVPVVLMKMFGPLIFADIRIKAVAEGCEWVIERCNIKTCEWSVVARIPGQIEDEFDDEEET